MKLVRQYHQEQAESKLFGHAPSGSKFGKLSGKSAEKNPALTMQIERALPLAMVVLKICHENLRSVRTTSK
jgi:hypothetical protein